MKYNDPTTTTGGAFHRGPLTAALGVALALIVISQGVAQDTAKQAPQEKVDVVATPDKFPPLTEPPCSYCVDQNLKGLTRDDDRVLAWIRGAHNGGAFPLRHFISKSRVINDTYGLFFYDPEGGYVSAFEKNYGFRVHGWRGGVLVVASEDGTLWSALTGRAISGPQQGAQLRRVPSMTTTWQHWLLLHPESTAYNLFDGKRYEVTELPEQKDEKVVASIGEVDDRLPRFTPVMGVESDEGPLAVSLENLPARAVRQSDRGEQSVVVFWYQRTGSAVAFDAKLGDRRLTFYADKISPETAPFKDRETGSRWTLAGRAVDGPLKGQELTWIPSLQCNWYAWSHEYPKTDLLKVTDDQ